MTGLRVGLVCPYSFDRPGGVQNHVRGLAAYLRQVGHDPYVLAPGSQEPADLGPGRFTSAGSALPIRYNGSIARVNFGPRSAARVRRWLREGRFDLIHIHEPITPSIGLLALWAGSAPVVATFHTATPRSRTMQVAGDVLRGSIAKIDAGIAVSEPARQVVVQHLGRDALVIPNGFTQRQYVVAAEAAAACRTDGGWRGGDRPRLTFLGRTDEPRKGLGVLLGALPAIRAAVGEVEVVVAGGSAKALPPGCRSLGAVDEPTKLRLLADTDVFVAPHVARESFGIVVIEALASGARVVASALPAFADLLEGGRLGEMFEVGDPAGLARAVERALAGPAPSTAVQDTHRFDWGVVGPAVVDVYRRVIADAGRRQRGLSREN